MRRYNKKAQSALEYTALIVILTGALMGMSAYMKRSLQGKYKQSADIYGGGFLYAPGQTIVVEDN